MRNSVSWSPVFVIISGIVFLHPFAKSKRYEENYFILSIDYYVPKHVCAG